MMNTLTKDCAEPQAKKRRILFFGHFGAGNFGNEGTLQAMLSNLRHLVPNAEFGCICTRPNTVAAAYSIAAVPSRTFEVRPKTTDGRLTRWARTVIVGIPNEIHQWTRSLKTLRDTDALVIPGTGLLTDAYTLIYWGPYDMFRWSVAARLRRCKILFVSVGAGPIYSRAGRFFVRSALSLADYRSYRDESTLQYLQGIGFAAANDPVYPDLAFSLPDSPILVDHDIERRRPVVGLGLMEYPGRYSVECPTGAAYSAYLEAHVELVKWLVAHEYDVRLLIGDLVDTRVTQEFRSLLKTRSVAYGEDRIVGEPIACVEDLLRQLAATDVVVAARFHNLVLALILNKPVIAISFHHKSASLMREMGLSEYCQDGNRLNSEGLIGQFSQLQQNVLFVKQRITERVGVCRDMLDEQYAAVISEICSNKR